MPDSDISRYLIYRSLAHSVWSANRFSRSLPTLVSSPGFRRLMPRASKRSSLLFPQPDGRRDYTD